MENVSSRSSEDERVRTLFFFLGDLLEVLVNYSNCEQDTCSRTDCSHEVCENGECTDAASTECSGGWDVSVQVLDHRVLTLTINHEFLVHELSGNISGAGTGDVDPDSREESTRSQNENGVDDGVNWILLNVIKTLWWTDVVCKTANRCLMASHVIILPFSEESNNKVASELSCEDLSEEVDVGHESGLQDDWDV